MHDVFICSIVQIRQGLKQCIKKIGLDLLIYYSYIDIHTSKATPSQQSTTLNPYWPANVPGKGNSPQ